MAKKDLLDLEKMENQLSEIEPTMDDVINRRINHIPFAKTIFWLCLKSNREDFFYLKELASFLKTSPSHVFNTLKSFIDIQILKKMSTGNLTEYHFIRNGNSPIILKYLDRAKKTLGLK